MRRSAPAAFGLLLGALLPSVSLGVEKNLLDVAELPGFERVETDHFVFFFHKEDRMGQADFEAMESFIQELAKKLEAQLPEKKVHFYKFQNVETKKKFTGQDGNCEGGYSSSEETGRVGFIHTLYARERHELTHVLLNNRHLPATFLAEGIAVFMQGKWHDRELDEWVCDFRKSRKLVSMADLMNAFGKHDDDITYPESGAFVSYLVKAFGFPRFAKLYKTAPEGFGDKGGVQLSEQVHLIYGEDIFSLERRWLSAVLPTCSPTGSSPSLDAGVVTP